MKKLSRLLVACFAAQLLFVGILNANVISHKTAENTSVCAMPSDEGEDGPFEGF